MSSSNQKIGRAWEGFYDAIRTKRLKHNGDKVLRQHAINAKRGRGRGGLIARKDNPESPRKIDAMVAMYIAYAALEDYLQKGKKQQTYRKIGRASCRERETNAERAVVDKNEE